MTAEPSPVKTLRTNPELDYTLREKLGEGCVAAGPR